MPQMCHDARDGNSTGRRAQGLKAAGHACGDAAALGNISLPTVGGARPTWEALYCTIVRARHTLDVMGMYWNLLAPHHTGERTWNPEQLEVLGTGRGAALYRAFEEDAARGVRVRLLSGVGISSDNPDEADELAQRFPGVVETRVWDASPWYDGGIMHMKMVVADSGQAMYLGSANMDLLSMAQVKELGVLITGAREGVGGDALALFRRWWDWARLAADELTVVAFDPFIYLDRRVPCWSALVNDNERRCPNPLEPPQSLQWREWRRNATDTKSLGRRRPAPIGHRGLGGGTATHLVQAMGQQSAFDFVSASPPELMGTGTHNRPVWEQDALVATILSAQRSVSLSVMDSAPSSLYRLPDEAVWWPALNDALTVAATVKGVNVRLLISHWNHTKARQEAYLKALVATASACHLPDAAEDRATDPACNGSLTVRLFEVPGWASTADLDGTYPPFSRVNHDKYIVSDKRANIGTSNMALGYCTLLSTFA